MEKTAKLTGIVGVLVILAITSNRYSPNKILKEPRPNNLQKIVYQFSEEESKEIRYFKSCYDDAMSARFSGRLEPEKIKESVDIMLNKYPNLSPETQKKVKDYVEGGLDFLRGWFELIGKSEAICPYDAKACELGLEIE